jgi:hypothetical protein
MAETADKGGGLRRAGCQGGLVAAPRTDGCGRLWRWRKRRYGATTARETSEKREGEMAIGVKKQKMTKKNTMLCFL